MKIDIFSVPRSDIFSHQGRYARLFILFLALAAMALVMGGYAYFHPDSPYYDLMENASFFLFAGSSVLVFITGERLQAYKMLTPDQEKQLADWCEKYEDIRRYRQLVAQSGRRVIHAEFTACKDYVEEMDLKEARGRQGGLG